MLGKLLKHEWNATMKVLLPANVVIVLLTVLGRIMLGLNIFETDSEIVQMIAVLCLILYILSLFAVCIACTIYIAVRFYKTVYTDEGYLLHTLPVTSTEIIWSKMMIGALWNLITSIVISVSVLLLVFGSLSPGSFGEMMNELSKLISTYLGSVFTGWVVFTVFLSVLSCFYSTLWLFAAISFGQLISKHKVLGSFIGYAIGYIVAQIVATVAMTANGLTNQAMLLDESVDAVITYVNTTFGISFVITLVFTVLYYFVTSYMMKRRLNLD
ncbi:MAG TPA: hypothetical protein VJZ01_11745 [Lachnospiraceae bacterium]|nr:hypothetical protein [Lachnospiraceae bacterium]